MALEGWVDRQIRIIQHHGYHGHKNHPKRTFDGKYIAGEPFDYEIFTPKVKWCFDAKECAGNHWNLSNAKPGQVNALKQCKNAGLDAFFLVYFRPTGRLIRFDVDTVLECEQSYLAEEEGVKFDINECL